MYQLLTLADILEFESLLDVDVLVISSLHGNKFIKVPKDHASHCHRLYVYLVHDEHKNLGHFHAIAKSTSATYV